MKSKIFMYLFIFTLLIVLFQYMNAKNIIEKYDSDYKKIENKVTVYKDSLKTVTDENVKLSYFNLSKNQDAIDYFYAKDLDAEKLIPVIKDALYSMNEREENPLIPYASTNGTKLLFNNIRLLNHKWVIADFSDGEIWGEVFLTYSVDENKDLKFEPTESFLYPLQ